MSRAISAIEGSRWINDADHALLSDVLKVLNGRDLPETQNIVGAKENYVVARVILDRFDAYEIDKHNSMEFVKLSEKSGVAQAMYFMGVFNATGIDGDSDNDAYERNDVAAKAWFKMAAELGNLAARADLDNYDTKYPPCFRVVLATRITN